MSLPMRKFIDSHHNKCYTSGLRDLLCSTGNSVQYSVTTELGKEFEKRIHTGTNINETLYCTPETKQHC